MSRRAIIEADFAETVRRFGEVVADLELGEDGDDSVTFKFGGVDYTVLIADTYPSGLSQVFGDREFNLPGTIPEVIARLVEQHRNTGTKTDPASRGPANEGDVEDGQSTGHGSSHGESSGDDEAATSLMHKALSPAPDCRLAELRADVPAARDLFGNEAVELSDMGDCCRLLLHIDPSAGGAIEAITADAWGIDLDKPVTVRMVVNAEDLAASTVPTLQVYQGRSREDSSFEPEKQLMRILSDFLRERAERPGKRRRLSGDAVEGRVAAARSDQDAPPGHAPQSVQLWSEADDRIMELQKRKAEAVDAALDCGSIATQLLRYALLRLPTLHEYCAICDEPHTQPPMLQRTVCGRDFCCWQFAQFGRLISDAEGLNSTAEVIDLLVCMAIHAAKSKRMELIFDPFPTLFTNDASKPALSSDTLNCMQALENLMKAVEAARNKAEASLAASWVNDAALLQQHGQLVQPMLQWIARSARCLLVPLRPEQRIANLATEWQYLLVSAAPEREALFQKLKLQHGSEFAFHGSPVENWHSILRNGLKNASFTPLMTSGAAHGKGIYLSPSASLSAGYSRVGKKRGGTGDPVIHSSSRSQEPGLTGNRKLSLESLKMLAVCEVVRHPSLSIHGKIWVAPKEETVATRFFLIYSDGGVPELSLDEVTVRTRLRACVEAFCAHGTRETVRAGPSTGPT